MTIEQKTGGRSLRHPLERARWMPVEIPKGETPKIDLGKDRFAILNVMSGVDLLRYDSPNYKRCRIVTNEEINDSRAPWAGKIRWVHSR